MGGRRGRGTVVGVLRLGGLAGRGRGRVGVPVGRRRVGHHGRGRLDLRASEGLGCFPEQGPRPTTASSPSSRSGTQVGKTGGGGLGFGPYSPQCNEGYSADCRLTSGVWYGGAWGGCGGCRGGCMDRCRRDTRRRQVGSEAVQRMHVTVLEAWPPLGRSEAVQASRGKGPPQQRRVSKVTEGADLGAWRSQCDWLVRIHSPRERRGRARGRWGTLVRMALARALIATTLIEARCAHQRHSEADGRHGGEALVGLRV